MRSRYAIAGTLLLVAVISGVYLAMSRGWVFAQNSQGLTVCSNATLNGKFSLVLLQSNEGLNTFGAITTPSTGFNTTRATATFDGVSMVTVTATTRMWSVAGQPLQYPGGFNPIAPQTFTTPYAVNPDCTLQLQNIFIQILPGESGNGTRTFLLIDGVTAPTGFGPTTPPSPNVVTRDIFFIGFGVSK